MNPLEKRREDIENHLEEIRKLLLAYERRYFLSSEAVERTRLADEIKLLRQDYNVQYAEWKIINERLKEDTGSA